MSTEWEWTEGGKQEKKKQFNVAKVLTLESEAGNGP